MRRIINNLRQQPEEVRRHILHVTTIVAGVVLLTLWIISFGTNLGGSPGTASIKDDLQPFSALKANLVDGYNSLQ